MDETPRRRSVIAALAAVGVGGIAGCLGADSNDDWLQNANGYENTVDRTGQQEVQIAVGANTGLSFDPAAVRVSPGTTVQWEWSSFGGGHNVVETDGRFESEIMYDAGETFSHTFRDPGFYRYVCTPHQTQGMLGAVEVVEE